MKSYTQIATELAPKSTRQKRIEAGLCERCGTPVGRGGKKTCAKCLGKAAEKYKAKKGVVLDDDHVTSKVEANATMADPEEALRPWYLTFSSGVSE